MANESIDTSKNDSIDTSKNAFEVTTKLGQTIKVEVIGRSFEYEDNYIDVVLVKCSGCPLDEQLRAGDDYDAPENEESRDLITLLENHDCGMFS